MAKKENAVVETEEVAVADETVVETVESTPEAPQKESFAAKAKEWFRKQCVTLKRKPQRIAFFFFIISSVVYLAGLNVLSQGPISDFWDQKNLGLPVFVVTLFSILVLVLFMNTFPKHGIAYKKGGKKHSMNYIMLALTFIFVGAMIACDAIYFDRFTQLISGKEDMFFNSMSQANKFQSYLSEDFIANPQFNADTYRSYLIPAIQLSIAHIVLLGISAVLLATLPLYRKLIMKINTSKVVESTEIKGEIDTEEDD